LAAIRKHPKGDQFDAFVAKGKDMQTQLNNGIKDEELLKNLNGAFASCFYWLDMPWFRNWQ
jgi:hypothetical protein